MPVLLPSTCQHEHVKEHSVIIAPQSSNQWHEPVMVEEVLQYLAPRPGSIIVDGTVGTGGHSHAIIPRILPDGRLIAIDQDQQALLMAKQRLTEFSSRITWIRANFKNLAQRLKELEILQVDGVLLDLGMSSFQVDNPERGFSFLKDGPLDMRMDDSYGLTAAMLVNELSADELAGKFKRFGEERYAYRIARRIVEVRKQKPITTTGELAELIKKSVPVHARFGRLHPATRSFQALRITVNDELKALQEVLTSFNAILSPGARVVILSFHSLEDRIVKHTFLEGKRQGVWSILTKKPLVPTRDEVDRNPRARSVKLRAIERSQS